VKPINHALRSDTRRSIRVSANHLAKSAVNLTAAIHTLAEQDGSIVGRARWDVEMIDVRISIIEIRRELAEIENALAEPAQAEAA
jgi:hypothetical protein